MGKYAPVLKAAECGSMTRAAQTMGYTQPSLGYIINNIENELGVKIFYRDQRGVTPTEVGVGLLDIMRQIEAMENRLQETARVSKQELLRVGILSSVAAQWMPEILETFYQVYPEVVVKLENEPYYLTGDLGVKEHKLDCCFFAGRCPSGLEALPLYEDLYYLVVGADSELANLQEASIWDMVDKYQFIPTNESTDTGSAIHEIYQQFAQSSHLDFQPQENQMAIGLVEKGMGITVLPGLALLDLIPNRAVKVIPLKEKLARTVSLLCPREAERSQLTNVFLRLTRQQVEQWKQEQKTKRPWLQ